MDIDPQNFLIAAEEVVVDARYIGAVVSRVFHILGAMILGGGLFYLRSVLAPAGVDACYAGRRAVWAKWVAAAVLLMLLSGIYNFLTIYNTLKAAGEKLPPTYHMLFGIKFLLALLVMFVASILAGKTSAAEKFREKMSLWLNVGWTAVLAIVVLGAVLRTYH